MHHLSHFLVLHGRSRKKKKPSLQPKLERMNARKNFDYEIPTTSTSADECCPPSARFPTSFRIDGSDVDQLELVYRSLGFESSDDLGIAVASWEASKIRSGCNIINSNDDVEGESGFGDVKVVGRNGGFNPGISFSSRADVDDKSDVGDFKVVGRNGGFNPGFNFSSHDDVEGKSDFGDVKVVCRNGVSSTRFSLSSRDDVEDISDVGDVKVGCRNGVSISADVEDKCFVVGRSGVSDSSINFNSPADVEGKIDVGRNGVRNGIKGVRPPVLTPPVITNLMMNIDGGCEWDNVRNFASREGSISRVDQQRCSVTDEVEEEGSLENVSTMVQRGTLSASCSFTTSNDDDSSSSTTEPPSSVSPNGFGCHVSANGRFRHITITHWQRGELLGRGSFGSVYEGICDGGYFIAVKEVSLLDQGEHGKQSVLQLEQEIDLLSQFEHDNIVRYYGTDTDESKLYIFLELVTKGSLLSLYRRYHLQDCQVSSYTRQILHGLKYLHGRGVVHRDVKCANILVDANGSVKLADFGLAKVTKFNDVKSCKGTPFWMAPEVVNQKNKGYGLAADIWSLGCTVLEMLTRSIPYSPMEDMAALYSIGNGIPPPVPDSLSREARDFIFQCFHVNPSDRPTAAQLLDHAFVKSPLPPSNSIHLPSPRNNRLIS